ncbi:MAG: sugar ABC transporter ATP-binding protein [Clostridia bacterium]|nr:sugar ABC transporter ATP-binding protein [Clostridia bacterium]
MDSWIRFENITKEFPGVVALNEVSFSIKKGEILALCGENGAGKSTLINICSGIYKPTRGKIYVKGEEVSFANADAAEHKGISTVFQEVPLCLNMTIADNMFLGPRPATKKGFLDRDYMNKHTAELLKIFNPKREPNDTLGLLTIAEQSLVQILKAIDAKPEFLILDEPTSALSDDQKEILFRILRKMREEDGVTIMYVSHRMEEIMQIADRAVVLKDGVYSGEVNTKEGTIDQIIRLMVGREMGGVSVYEEREIGEEILKVTNLNRGRKLKDVSFSLKKGEILGFSGFQGAGRTEAMRAVFGLDKVDSMDIEIDGKKTVIKNPRDAVKNGIALISENRRDDGVISNFDVQNNVVAATLNKVAPKYFMKNGMCAEESKKYVDMMRIKVSGLHQMMVNLSGGNQQKVIVGRWLMTEPRILICDEPTRGIDVGAKSEIHSILMQLAKQGVSIIVISSELPEIMAVCDRVIVMCEGKVSGELMRDELSEEALVTLASDISINKA